MSKFRSALIFPSLDASLFSLFLSSFLDLAERLRTLFERIGFLGLKLILTLAVLGLVLLGGIAGTPNEDVG